MITEAVQRRLVARAPDRLVSFVSAAKARRLRRQATAQLAPFISERFGSATSHTVLVAFEDTAVVRLGQASGSSILKVARNKTINQALLDEISALQILRNLPALQTLELETAERPTSLIAVVTDQGEDDGRVWFTQTMFPGVDTLALDGPMAPLVAAASSALRPIYLATAQLIDPGCETTGVATDAIAIVERHRPHLAATLAELQARLTGSALDRPLHLSRLHGDFAPTNVLWEANLKKPTGIIDWKFRDRPLPPEIDMAHFALALISHRAHCEYGATVTRLLSGTPGRGEAAVLAEVANSGPNGFEASEAIALAWLHHVSYGLEKSSDLRANPVWLANNVDGVLIAMQLER